MIIKLNNLEDFFIEKVKSLPISREDTKAYVTSTFVKYKNTTSDLSKKSLTIEFSEAKSNWSFSKFQEIGDWILWAESMFPTALNDASKEYYHTLGQICFYKCYIITKRNWKVFEEIADTLPNIIYYFQNLDT